MKKITSIFMMSTVILTIRKIFILHRPTVTAMPMLLKKMDMDQQILEKNTGVLIIRELPDTVKLKETEAEAYSAVWDLMIKLEKSLPMAYIFYGQDSLVEENTRYDEIGIFLPDSLFLKNLERHVKKAEAIIYAEE
jgi:hypothetical protein